jgi:hypothetical protein
MTAFEEQQDPEEAVAGKLAASALPTRTTRENTKEPAGDGRR